MILPGPLTNLLELDFPRLSTKCPKIELSVIPILTVEKSAPKFHQYGGTRVSRCDQRTTYADYLPAIDIPGLICLTPARSMRRKCAQFPNPVRPLCKSLVPEFPSFAAATILALYGTCPQHLALRQNDERPGFAILLLATFSALFFCYMARNRLTQMHPSDSHRAHKPTLVFLAVFRVPGRSAVSTSRPIRRLCFVHRLVFTFSRWATRIFDGRHFSSGSLFDGTGRPFVSVFLVSSIC
jgi:hypothetical protein